MPTRSGTGSGGSRALGPLSPGGGPSGNKVGVKLTLRPRKDLRSFSEAAGLGRNVAIARLAKHGPVFRFLFAMSIVLFAFISPPLSGLRSAVRSNKGQVTHASVRARHS